MALKETTVQKYEQKTEWPNVFGKSFGGMARHVPFERLSLLERTAYSNRKNGSFDGKERLIPTEGTILSQTGGEMQKKTACPHCGDRPW